MEAVNKLVTEQVQLGHLEPSTSPWNTPIFAIKKKSGKWRLLHDLRAINAQMNLFGSIQRGLPLLSALPKQWKIVILDIKDCFFSIPLCHQDRPRFAFTIPALNHMEPDKRFQWKVLPQGMANSPTMCQLFVQAALEPVRQYFPSLLLLHYMDDILLCHKDMMLLQKSYSFLIKMLNQWGLQIAAEKVQISEVGSFLGTIIFPDKILPQKLEIRRDHLHTLNDFQKLLGSINWLRPFLKISSAELKPLFDILKGDSHISSPRALTPAANKALQVVENALQNAQLQRIEESQPFDLCVFKTAQLPTAVLWQDGPLLWIHPNASPAKVIDWYPNAVVQLALCGLKAAVTHFGRDPKLLIVPYTATQVQVLVVTSDDWAVLVTSFSGQIDNHYPRHPILQFALNQAIVFPQVTAKNPLPEGIIVYTDGSKTGVGAYVTNNKIVSKQYNETSPQIVECLVVLEVLKAFPGPLNIVSDSSYVVNAVNLLEADGVIKSSSKVADIFQKIQAVLLHRRFPVYITHVRAHSGLPGPISRGNDLADRATRVVAAALSSQVDAARNFHKQFHVTAETLRRRFALARKEDR